MMTHLMMSSTKLKSYIIRQFKKFIKNANVKTGDKDRKQTTLSQYKSQDNGKRESKDAGQGNGVPAGPKCYRCHGFRHMKQECPTYLKSIGKSKALATTLSESEPEAYSNESDQEGIVSAFIATIESTKEVVDVIDDEEELMKSNLRIWMIRMTSTLPTQSYTRSLRSMKSSTGWP